LLFRKFAADFANKYKVASVQLNDEAIQLLVGYPWPGNVRELKNIAEQISVLSTDKVIGAEALGKFLQPYPKNRLPVLQSGSGPAGPEFANEREILYKLFFDMKKDVTELKRMFVELLQNPELAATHPQFVHQLQEWRGPNSAELLPANTTPSTTAVATAVSSVPVIHTGYTRTGSTIQEHEEVEESLNIIDKEKELIIKALKKHKSKRKDAALDLGISERTLYRKLKEYDIEE
jgi:DNA-binding NtrC family response regulator